MGSHRTTRTRVFFCQLTTRDVVEESETVWLRNGTGPSGRVRCLDMCANCPRLCMFLGGRIDPEIRPAS
jgi:hypothetical protein